MDSNTENIDTFTISPRKNNIDDMNDIDVENVDNEEETKQIQTFRYKFTSEIMALITNFAKLHQYDDRKTYKEAWQEWCETNNDVISIEVERLQELGCDKDINDKMYKAGRYYFRKKGTSVVEPKKRRIYTTLGQNILEAMDLHISSSISNDDFTPAGGYCDFCENNQDVILEEIRSMMKQKSLSTDDISSKIKKTYKNRYYIISRS